MKPSILAACLTSSVLLCTPLQANASVSATRRQKDITRFQHWPITHRKANPLKVNLTSRNTSHLQQALAESAKRVALNTCTIGWCFAAVKNALRPFGICLNGSAAWMAADQLLKSNHFQLVPMSKLQLGDIMVHGRSKSHPSGHIAVYLGNNAEASDHLQPVITKGNYGKTLVFRFNDKHKKPSLVASGAFQNLTNMKHHASAKSQPAQNAGARSTVANNLIHKTSTVEPLNLSDSETALKQLSIAGNEQSVISENDSTLPSIILIEESPDDSVSQEQVTESISDS